ncbi:MAG: hypothetical protein ACYCYB_09825 [Candidatus Dormibacteria bacterium]
MAPRSTSAAREMDQCRVSGDGFPEGIVVGAGDAAMGALGHSRPLGSGVERGGGLGAAAGALRVGQLLDHSVHGLRPWVWGRGLGCGSQLLGSAPAFFALSRQAWKASSETAVLGERERTTSPLTPSSVGSLPWRARQAETACSTDRLCKCL